MVISGSNARRWLAALAILAGDAPARAGFTIMDLGVIGAGGTSAANAINAGGEAAGYVINASGNMVAANSATSRLQPVSVPGGATSSTALAINGGGTVAGYFSGPGVAREGFSSSGGSSTAIGFLSVTSGSNTVMGTYTQVNGINDSGQMVGTGNVPGGVANRAFVYSNGSFTMIAPVGGGNPATSPLANYANAINNGGTVVGTSELTPGGIQQAFYTTGSGYTPASLTSRNAAGDFLGSTTAAAIDTDGDIAGSGAVGNSQHAFFAADAGGPLVDLGTLSGATSSTGLGVNDGLLVVGTSGGHAFLWGGPQGMYDLNSLSLAPGWILTKATAINDGDQISGEGLLNGVLHGFVLSPIDGQSLFSGPNTVPSPPALTLSAVGLAITWGWSRRKK